MRGVVMAPLERLPVDVCGLLGALSAYIEITLGHLEDMARRDPASAAFYAEHAAHERERLERVHAAMAAHRATYAPPAREPSAIARLFPESRHEGA